MTANISKHHYFSCKTGLMTMLDIKCLTNLVIERMVNINLALQILALSHYYFCCTSVDQIYCKFSQLKLNENMTGLPKTNLYFSQKTT